MDGKNRKTRMLMADDKGFTLVEMIVVLVMLAILSAILVPNLLGYIDKAKEKQFVLNAKSFLTATQTQMTELYGTDQTFSVRDAMEIRNMADVSTATSFIVYVRPTLDTTAGACTPGDKGSYKIVGAKYVEGGKTLYYDTKSWSNKEFVDSSTKILEIIN